MVKLERAERRVMDLANWRVQYYFEPKYYGYYPQWQKGMYKESKQVFSPYFDLDKSGYKGHPRESVLKGEFTEILFLSTIRHLTRGVYHPDMSSILLDENKCDMTLTTMDGFTFAGLDLKSGGDRDSKPIKNVRVRSRQEITEIGPDVNSKIYGGPKELIIARFYADAEEIGVHDLCERFQKEDYPVPDVFVEERINSGEMTDFFRDIHEQIPRITDILTGSIEHIPDLPYDTMERLEELRGFMGFIYDETGKLS